MTTKCIGSGRRVIISPGQRRTTAGAVRPNRATDVHCPDCGSVFADIRVVHTDHGIPTGPRAIIPNHTPEA